LELPTTWGFVYLIFIIQPPPFMVLPIIQAKTVPYGHKSGIFTNISCGRSTVNTGSSPERGKAGELTGLSVMHLYRLAGVDAGAGHHLRRSVLYLHGLPPFSSYTVVADVSMLYYRGRSPAPFSSCYQPVIVFQPPPLAVLAFLVLWQVIVYSLFVCVAPVPVAQFG